MGNASDRFVIPGALWVERQQYRDGPDCYIVWRPHTSVMADSYSSVLAAARWPATTKTGTELRAWLKSHQPVPISDDPPAIENES